MVDVKNKKCIGKDCTRYPNYNYKGETKRLYCNNCKLPDMINIVTFKRQISRSPSPTILTTSNSQDTIKSPKKKIERHFSFQPYSTISPSNTSNMDIDIFNRRVHRSLSPSQQHGFNDSSNSLDSAVKKKDQNKFSI
eukprot:Pgem_evm1s8906